MYSIQCILYSVHCTCTMHYTVYSLRCTLYIVDYTLCNVHRTYTVYTVQCILGLFTICSTQCIVYSAYCILGLFINIHCIVFVVYWDVYEYTLYSVYCILGYVRIYTVQCILGYLQIYIQVVTSMFACLLRYQSLRTLTSDNVNRTHRLS